MTAWTTPRTWVTGEVLSSANMNTHVRDNLAFYGGTDSMGTTPPASPGNGQRWVYPFDTTNGVYWQFLYVSSGSYWGFLGGDPAFSYVAADETTTTYGAYTTLGTPGPSIALPRAGDYDVEIGFQKTVQGGFPSEMSYDIGATAAVDADQAYMSSLGNPAAVRRKTGLTAVTLTAKYKLNGGNGANGCARRWMRVYPVKVT